MVISKALWLFAVDELERAEPIGLAIQAKPELVLCAAFAIRACDDRACAEVYGFWCCVGHGLISGV